ncbi:CRISPR-associated endonuclease/helicase Cas3 [Calidithermus terrae]|uniref:CRISPR-associated endonuclease/helicase Cas3 n=1 Tax=Calidithermus terrae TaxID=1408545 RepID=A0A399ET38_9DEIN|nr:CRISPR-associated helicase Cas3' [Calidithermus terrae]RIH87837.1 CRISPR-associated endonuclease/helicase Cas3 [Calidithermus terrae]
MRLSEAAKALWGKSDRERDDGAWHPLLHHMLDVAACAEAILEREPRRTRELYARDLGYADYARARPWLLSLIALHDLGKASPAFQALWGPGAARVREQGLTWRKEPEYVPHGFISQLALEEEEHPLRAALAYDLLRQAADAVGCHHGLRASPAELEAVGDLELGSGPWQAVRRELVEAVLELFGAGPEDAPGVSELGGAGFYRLAGLTSFADWIGSSQDFFGFVAPVGCLGSYYREALAKAHAALDRIGWRERRPLRPEKLPFEQVPFDKKGKTYAPRPLQRAVAGLLEGCGEPTLLLIEAPMGEGKTEAAFYGHLRLQQDLGHRGMYVALPTRATGNAMFERTAGFLEGMGRSEPVDLQLLHGAALLNDGYAQLRLRAVDEGKTPGSRPAVSAQEWFSSKKRAQLSEYGVGTIDQALLAVLPLKHNFVRMWGLGNRTVVIDEVHAYDTYTSRLIEALLSWLYALGSSAIVMSATLPKERREALLRAYGAGGVPESVPYPRVFKVAGGRVEAVSFEADPNRRVALRLQALPAGFAQVVPEVLASVAEGGCTACIVNTVERAQQLYRALEGPARAQGVELLLFHARYPAEQRQRLEEGVLGLFGKQGRRPARAVLVGTQVLEQSLDLDFDVMFTDLAPADLVLQRAGRLWRHDRADRAPNQARPVLHVMGLAQEAEVPDFQHAEYLPGKKLYWESVYDRAILLRTYALLRERAGLELPGDIDPLVEAVYGPGLLRGIPESLEAAILEATPARENQGRQDRAQAAQAFVGLPFDGSWLRVPALEQHDPEENPEKHRALLAATRLGDPSVSVIPVHDLGGGSFECAGVRFGLEESLEGRWCLAKKLYLQNLSISRADLVAELSKAGRPRSWQEHPLLRNCYPLVLKGGRAGYGNTEVELDATLGLVYHKQKG